MEAETQPTDAQNLTVTAREDTPRRMHQGAFLAAYAQSARISKAAEAAGIARRTHYDWVDSDHEYRAEFVKAKELAMQTLEDEATRRALGDGCEPSDRLMEFLLKGGRPDIYRERVEHSTKPGAPLEMNVSASEILLGRIAGLASRIDQKS